MLTVVNYDRESNKSLLNFLEEQNIDYKLTNDEFVVGNSSKVLLPNFTDFKSVLKKLQLSNLYNLLKIFKKPILGIGNGLILCCESICDLDLIGIGLINSENNLSYRSRSARKK